jgi:glycine cleavage system transcriptional repressor
MKHLALSAIGRDRPGIVASVTRVLLDHGLNIEDSQATILRGHFTIMLIVAAPDDLDGDALAADLGRVRDELGLEAVVLQDVDELDAAPPRPSHMVTVYGVDHPGIVHRATSALAERGIDITDLNTRLVGAAEEPLYALLMEVAVPEASSADELRAALEEVGRREGVEVTLHELEQEAL